MMNSLQTIGCLPSTSVWSLPFEEAHEKERKRKSYLVHPLVAGRHEDECQVRAKTAKMEGGRKEGEKHCSSCERPSRDEF